MQPEPPALSPELSSQWGAYIEAERSGMRDRALSALHEFIENFPAERSKATASWVKELARSAADGDGEVALRTPLLEAIVIPTLVEGLRAGDSECARILAAIFDTLARTRAGLDQLPEGLRTPRLLLEAAVANDPRDQRAGSDLLHVIAASLRHSIHEVRYGHGVLWDTNGASPEQCSLLDDELTLFRQLQERYAATGDFADLIDQCDFHFRSYRAYLDVKVSYDSYGHYLETAATRP